MEAIIPIALLGALGVKVLDVIKYLTNKDWNALATQVGAWLTGVVLVFLASAADIFDQFTVPGLDQTFADLNGASKLILGASILSLLGIAGVDFRKAFDNTDSAKVPSLVPGVPLPPL